MKTMKCLTCNDERFVADTVIIAICYYCQKEMVEVKKDISLALVADVQVDDFVLIHVGYALNKISEEEAERTLQLFAEAGLTEAVAL